MSRRNMSVIYKNINTRLLNLKQKSNNFSGDLRTKDLLNELKQLELTELSDKNEYLKEPFKKFKEDVSSLEKITKKIYNYLQNEKEEDIATLVLNMECERCLQDIEQFKKVADVEEFYREEISNFCTNIQNHNKDDSDITDVESILNKAEAKEEKLKSNYKFGASAVSPSAKAFVGIVDFLEPETGKTPLMLACDTKNTKLVELLFRYNPGSLVTDSEGNTLLHHLVQNQNYKILEYLANESNWDFYYYSAYPPYFLRAIKDQENQENNTPLNISLSFLTQESHEITELLLDELEAGPNIYKGSIFNSPLFTCLDHTNLNNEQEKILTENVKLLLDNGANYLKTYPGIGNSLHVAAKYNHPGAGKSIYEKATKQLKLQKLYTISDHPEYKYAEDFVKEQENKEEWKWLEESHKELENKIKQHGVLPVELTSDIPLQQDFDINSKIEDIELSIQKHEEDYLE